MKNPVILSKSKGGVYSVERVFLNVSLSDHRIRHFNEAGNVRTFHIVDEITLTSVPFTCFVNTDHEACERYGREGDFVDISNPDVATPPAFDALPGANRILAD